MSASISTPFRKARSIYRRGRHFLKLFWSSRSPFARKVHVVAHELAIESRITLVPTLAIPTDEDPALVAVNPLAQIPALVTDAGAAIFDSIVICEWLNMQHGKKKRSNLFPENPERRLTALRQNAVVDGALSYLLLMRAELRRPEEHRNSRILATWSRRIDAALDFIEEEKLDSGADTDIGQISMAILLSYHDFRIGRDWRDSRPISAQWFAQFEARPSMQRTAFSD